MPITRNCHYDVNVHLLGIRIVVKTCTYCDLAQVLYSYGISTPSSPRTVGRHMSFVVSHPVEESLPFSLHCIAREIPLKILSAFPNLKFE